MFGGSDCLSFIRVLTTNIIVQQQVTQNICFDQDRNPGLRGFESSRERTKLSMHLVGGAFGMCNRYDMKILFRGTILSIM